MVHNHGSFTCSPPRRQRHDTPSPRRHSPQGRKRSRGMDDSRQDSPVDSPSPESRLDGKGNRLTNTGRRSVSEISQHSPSEHSRHDTPPVGGETSNHAITRRWRGVGRRSPKNSPQKRQKISKSKKESKKESKKNVRKKSSRKQSRRESSAEKKDHRGNHQQDRENKGGAEAGLCVDFRESPNNGLHPTSAPTVKEMRANVARVPTPIEIPRGYMASEDAPTPPASPASLSPGTAFAGITCLSEDAPTPPASPKGRNKDFVADKEVTGLSTKRAFFAELISQEAKKGRAGTVHATGKGGSGGQSG
ncbi:unnamed protein product, partial [Discosporangium mesarthrocarpum]